MAPIIKETLSNEGLLRFILKLALEKYGQLVRFHNLFVFSIEDHVYTLKIHVDPIIF